MPTLPTSLLVKGSNFPPNWQTLGTFGYDAFVDFFDPQPTALPSGIIIGGVMSGVVAITLTSAQLLTLAATPVQILNAPGLPPKGFGSSMVINPTAMYFQYLFGGTAYTIGNADNVIRLEYTGQANALLSTLATGLVDQAVNRVVYASPAVAGVLQAQSVVANLGLELKLTGTAAALTLGTGTLAVTLKYDILVLS